MSDDGLALCITRSSNIVSRSSTAMVSTKINRSLFSARKNLTTYAILVLRNDWKCKYIFMFHEIKSEWRGLNLMPEIDVPRHFCVSLSSCFVLGQEIAVYQILHITLHSEASCTCQIKDTRQYENKIYSTLWAAVCSNVLIMSFYLGLIYMDLASRINLFCGMVIPYGVREHCCWFR